MVGAMFGTETPENTAAVDGEINRLLSFSFMTAATIADGLAATVVVRNEIVLVVNRVSAGSYPRNRRRFRAGRT